MLKDIIWAEDRGYRTGSEDEPLQFYLDSLCNSTSFDLLLGYFSSSALNILSLGFANFIYSGGRMRIIINNILSQEDKRAIEKGQNGQQENLLDFSNFSKLYAALDEYGLHFFECFAWLIANERIEIKIIKPKNKKGISHYKSGTFSDGTDTVGFKSSCNFTAYGLLENLEESECFLSWEDNRSSKFINKQIKYFNEIFNEEASFIEYLDIRDVQEAITETFGTKNLLDLLIQEKYLLEKKKIAYQNLRIQKSISSAQTLTDNNKRLEKSPKFPYREGPRQYQINAYENWIKNDKKGLFNMATGTGKTLTSLNCLLEQYRESNSYKAIILVPTRALLEQWKNECKKFNFSNIIAISTKEKWPQNISFLNSASNFIEVSFVVIVTYAAFYRKNFQSHFKDLPADTLLIADEAHNLGSSNVSKLLSTIHLEKRIGLSATPDRQFDELGNKKIEMFFNDEPPYIYNFTMEQAMKLGWLCKYKYYPHVIRLTAVELSEYIKKSKKLIKYFDSSTKKYKDCKEVEMLLLERKRIIHKAFNKLEKFKEIVSSEFESRGYLKYSLVYVPEGIEPNYEQDDNAVEENGDIRLINEYTKIISNTDSSIMVKQFTSKTINRDNVISEFQKGEIDVLTSIKCLDEGVDVPRTELAIFCSSTGNPRQFIQRRGRVLRNHKDKTFAVIHDLIVLPETGDESTFEMERSMIQKELERVVDFSSLSMNKIDTYTELKNILTYYKISLSNIKND
ncbi:DEAD/DEAH box helicase family protein [Chryseobacterium indoltheticum]|jgi:superfamily II DNA or RNA helicase|uniref:DEAD/DEAH box helicase family protein n=1 Tax=Chryseobacterium indoltheticum TaxID=254 RepID=UPI00242CB4F2|nr:DEAD/DEAH box helicase family protein [Chryseobacterium indoltheticum]MDF2833022.1 type restriction protein res subunit [Chryseobacterium indoltheticum]